MGSPELLTRRAPAGGPRRRSVGKSVGRVAALLRAAALAWVLVLSCLTLWSVVPLAVGWHPLVIVSGSMLPTIRPGDVVVVSAGSADVRPGSIVLVADPSTPTGQVVHRVVEAHPDGTLVTRGDANPSPDPSPRTPRDVVGTVRFVVPGVGRLALLRYGPTAADVTWAVATIGACLALGLFRRAH